MIRFLGHYQPQIGKPALWELDSDQHYDVGSRGSNFFVEKTRFVYNLIYIYIYIFYGFAFAFELDGY